MVATTQWPRAGRWALAAAAATLVFACAKPARRPSLPRPQLGANVVWHAPLRLRCFAQGQRLRTDALLWLQRPDRFRLHVLGPQGGLMLALACDGQAIALWDAAAGRHTMAPATAAAIDALMPLAPLHLSPSGWLALWLGELAPDGAQLQRDDDGQLSEVQVAASGQQPSWRLQLHQRDRAQLPQRLSLHVATEPPQVCEMSFGKASSAAPSAPNLFHLTTPQGAQVRQLGPDGQLLAPPGA